MCNTTMDMTFYKQQRVTGISLRVFEIPQSLNTRSPTHTSSASVVANNGFWFFLFLFISFQRTKFNSLRLPGNIMNGTKLISWCCKIIEIEENHMHINTISETLRKKYWIWTVINGQMLVSQCEKEVGD